MSDSNCPNCGAPITGPSCPYCSTRFENVASMAIGRPVRVSFEYDGLTYEFDMAVENMTIDVDAGSTDYYSDGNLVFTSISPEYRAHFSGRVVNRDGKLLEVRQNG